MKRLLILAVAIAAVSMMAESSSTAQTYNYNQGYQFGAGLDSARHSGYGYHGYSNRRGVVGFNQFRNDFLSRQFRSEQPPYFAKYPPVYYSHAVKRPYGVSPFAAPAGIAPVEMGFGVPVPVSVTNPFFQKDVAPVKAAKPNSNPETKMKTTWVRNPFLSTLVAK